MSHLLNQLIRLAHAKPILRKKLLPMIAKSASARSHYESVKNRGKMPSVDMSEYPPIRGMEGPFRFRNGDIVYYDPKEGAYYDSKRDMYLSQREADRLMMASLQKSAMDPRRLEKLRQLDPEDSQVVEMAMRQMGRRGRPVPEGTGGENGKIRWHRYRSAVRVIDLTNAGRRGKMVDKFALYDLDYIKDDAEQALVEAFSSTLHGSDYSSALDRAKILADTIRMAKVQESTEKGVRVDPAGTEPVKVRGSGFYLESEPQDFVVRDLSDQANLPAIMPPMRAKKTHAKKFYAWAQKNEDRLSSMSFRQLLKELDAAKIKYHYWLTRD